MSEVSLEQYQEAIARIFNKEGEVVGTGFLVAGGYLLTCAHVVADALGIPPTDKNAPTEKVRLDFLLVEVEQPSELEGIYAEVLVWFAVNPHEKVEDIAVLKILSALPKAIQPMSLQILSSFEDERNFKIYGFPQGSTGTGIKVSTVCKGIVGKGGKWVQMNSQEGSIIDEGHSGSPVWDKAVGCVGMIVASHSKGSEAFMIPAKTLLQALTNIKGYEFEQTLQPQLQNDQKPLTADSERVEEKKVSGTPKMERSELISTLSKFMEEELKQLAATLNMPNALKPGVGASRGEWAIKLFEWAGSPTGCSIEKLTLEVEALMPKPKEQGTTPDTKPISPELTPKANISRSKQLELNRFRIELQDQERKHKTVREELRVADATNRDRLEISLAMIVEKIDELEQKIKALE
jgi:hypothetical protein